MTLMALAVGLGLGLCAAVLVVSARRQYAVVVVEGASMLPTVRDQDRVLVRRLRPEAVRCGDVVVLGDERRWRVERTGLVLKRVAALPGEPVPRLVPAAAGQTVPPGRVVLLGDNQAVSRDSRECGFYPLSQVRGVMVRRLAGPGRPVRARASATAQSGVEWADWRMP